MFWLQSLCGGCILPDPLSVLGHRIEHSHGASTPCQRGCVGPTCVGAKMPSSGRTGTGRLPTRTGDPVRRYRAADFRALLARLRATLSCLLGWTQPNSWPREGGSVGSVHRCCQPAVQVPAPWQPWAKPGAFRGHASVCLEAFPACVWCVGFQLWVCVVT